MNLISNALKYTQNGGFVKVLVDTIKVFQNSKIEEFIKVVVWDNGLGISKEN